MSERDAAQDLADAIALYESVTKWGYVIDEDQREALLTAVEKDIGECAEHYLKARAKPGA